jgi:hypothetical protein
MAFSRSSVLLIGIVHSSPRDRICSTCATPKPCDVFQAALDKPHGLVQDHGQ